MRTKLTTKGLEDAFEELGRLGKDVDGAAMRALQAGAAVIQDGMKAAVAVDTGDLRDHILIDGPTQDGHFISVEIGVIHKKSFTPKRTAIKAVANEYGTSSMAAQPFMRTGFAAAKSRARQAMIKVLAEELAK